MSSSRDYQYSYVELDEIVKNPEEYIIPECLGACKKLWDKNIETFMASNYDDKNLYVLIMNESIDNLNIIKNKMILDNRYYYDVYNNAYGIRVPGMDEESKKELESLCDVFDIQDTKRYKTSDDFLEDYKYTGGTYFCKGSSIYREKNPLLENITLSGALFDTGKQDLYVSRENRVYDNEFYLNWHKKYLDYRDNNIRNILDEINHNKNNNNVKYSKLRDFYLTGERDQYEKILGGEFLKELITTYNHLSADELFEYATMIIDDFHNGKIPKQREKEMEQKILLSLAAIQDTEDIKVKRR